MALAGVAPPATLSVVRGFSNHTESISWPSMDWKSTKYYAMESPKSPFEPHYHTSQRPVPARAAQPSSEVLRIATLAAESMTIIPPTPPAVNSSFHVQFFGPSMQCSLANSSQEIGFKAYTDAMVHASMMKVTRSVFETGALNWQWGEDGIPGGIAPLMNVYSAFSPWSGFGGWLQTGAVETDYSVDAFNNWVPDISLPQRGPFFHDDGENKTQQVWIQTADQAIVCTFGNASFEVWFEFVNALQTKVEYSVKNFTTFVAPSRGSNVAASSTPLNSYMAMYLAFSGLVNGNISTTLTSSATDVYDEGITFDGNLTIYEGSSKILQHGLSACDEIAHGYVSVFNLFIDFPCSLEGKVGYISTVDRRCA